jgi:hypothetical protein
VQQAEDRAHRIGQTQSVNVHLLLVKDSIDDLMWELLQNKLATTGQVLDGEATRMEVRLCGLCAEEGADCASFLDRVLLVGEHGKHPALLTKRNSCPVALRRCNGAARSSRKARAAAPVVAGRVLVLVELQRLPSRSSSSRSSPASPTSLPAAVEVAAARGLPRRSSGLLEGGVLHRCTYVCVS